MALVASGVLYASGEEAAAALGAGAGMTLVGGSALLAGLYGSREHMSEGRMIWGILLTALAAAGAGMGAGAWAASDANSDKLSVAGMSLGAGLVSIGLPLWVSGAPPPQQPPTLRSPAMAYAGYALFALTAVGVTTGLVGIAAAGAEGEARVGVGVRGATAFGIAGSLTLTGIPLVVAGSQAPASAVAQF